MQQCNILWIDLCTIDWRAKRIFLCKIKLKDILVREAEKKSFFSGRPTRTWGGGPLRIKELVLMFFSFSFLNLQPFKNQKYFVLDDIVCQVPSVGKHTVINRFLKYLHTNMALLVQKLLRKKNYQNPFPDNVIQKNRYKFL